MVAMHSEHGFRLTHASNRKRFAVTGNPMSDHRLSPQGSKSAAMFAVSAAPGQSSGSGALKHASDETLLVLSGSFEMQVEGKKTVLGPGDSVFIPRGSHHRFCNVGTRTGEAAFVLGPPAYREVPSCLLI